MTNPLRCSIDSAGTNSAIETHRSAPRVAFSRQANGRGGGYYRCVGIGVGPANLSLASLLHDRPQVSNLFLDKKERFSWHDGQQIPGATLQVSALKDLVTLADPTNRFSFLSYLHAQGKIYHYINAQFDAVPRQEFRNYLEWASRANENVCFGEEVLAVEFDGAFVLHTDRRQIKADNIAVGIGNRPWVPAVARGKLGITQFHVSEFVDKARTLAGQRVAVIGGGQSGAEAFLDLTSRSSGALPSQVCWISRRPNFLPIDDSPFTNDFFMPCHSNHFFELDRPEREAFNRQHLLTSDGISEATLRQIYQRIYMLRFVDGEEDLIALCPNREVTDVGKAGSGWEIAMANNHAPGTVERVRADVIVWATGFRPGRMDFLAPLAGRLEREGDEYRIDRDFAVCWDAPPDRSIFVQNAARQQRGLADPNLSLLAWRSQRIVDRMCGSRTTEQLASFIQWGTGQPIDALRAA